MLSLSNTKLPNLYFCPGLSVSKIYKMLLFKRLKELKIILNWIVNAEFAYEV